MCRSFLVFAGMNNQYRNGKMMPDSIYSLTEYNVFKAAVPV
jgi:hypothetical protein